MPIVGEGSFDITGPSEFAKEVTLMILKQNELILNTLLCPPIMYREKEDKKDEPKG